MSFVPINQSIKFLIHESRPIKHTHTQEERHTHTRMLTPTANNYKPTTELNFSSDNLVIRYDMLF